MKINFNPYLNNEISWAIFNLLSHEQIKNVAKLPKEKDVIILDIELKINGEEVDFENLIKIMVKSFNKCVESNAKEIIKDKFYEIQNKVANIIEDLDSIEIKLEE